MKKDIRLLIIGLCVIIASAGVIFFGLSRYLDGQTEQDVRKMASSFLEEVTNQEVSRYDAVKMLRFSQVHSVKRELESFYSGDKDEARDFLEKAARFQELSNLSLIAEDGSIDTVYGDPLESFGDKDYLMEHLIGEGEEVVTGAYSKAGQLMVYGSPAAIPMQDGSSSAGLLWCKPMSLFSEIMNLDNPDSMVYFHMIRKDTTYVIETDDSWGSSYEELVLGYVRPENMTAREAMDQLRGSMERGETFVMHNRYVDEEKGINIRRSMRAVPLDNSNWYLLAVLPFGVLDEAISEMSQKREDSMYAAMGILTLVLLTVFLGYIFMIEHQMKELSRAKAAAEEASQKAQIARMQAEESREEALAASKAKSEFLSNMSHDIRTPMNAIVGMTAIAKDHMDDPARVEDCLKKITLSGRQLLGLINDILDMSKIESGKMVLNPEALSLRETMEAMCDIVRPQIRVNGQHFDIIISNILAEEVYCDSVRLNQVLLNFLSNAMKFTPEGGSIEIHLWQEPSRKGEDYVRTHLAVSDTGMGMSEEFKQKLFTAFEREDSRRVQKTQGTGLGLTITKYIVDAMGGSIEVDSAAGSGTTFHVTIDFEKAPDAGLTMELPPWHILVVDDNEDLLRTAKLSLEELGVRAETCLSGEEAVSRTLRAEQEGDPFFALLIDYKMEGMNGIECAREILSKTGHPVPISLISAYDWSEIEQEARSAGISGFIAKPLFKSTLYHELKKYAGPKGASLEERTEKEKAVTLSGMHILLAEDNDFNAEIAISILEDEGCSLTWAEDGQIAVKLFSESESQSFDCILMDLRMPHMNGLEAARAIRALNREDAKTIPIIAMTADAFAEDAERCLEAGMNAHLSKPVDVERLIRTLEKFRKDQAEKRRKEADP